jgi:hypothetical protein
MPLEVVQVDEHILGTARDLDTVDDRRHARIVHLASAEVNPHKSQGGKWARWAQWGFALVVAGQ